VTALGIVVGIQALALLFLGLRNSGLKADAKDADVARHAIEKQLQETAREFLDYKDASEHQLSALRADIAELDADLEACVGPGDRRLRLEQLLQKTASRKNGGDPPKLH